MLLHKNDPFRDGKCKDSITLRGRGCNLLSDQTSPAAPAADPGADDGQEDGHERDGAQDVDHDIGAEAFRHVWGRKTKNQREIRALISR